MKKQIKRISVAQTSKVIAIMYVAFSLIYSLIGLPMIIFGNAQVKGMGFMYLFMPILAGITGFIFVAIGCWVYNLVASKVGGIEFEVSSVDEASSSDDIAPRSTKDSDYILGKEIREVVLWSWSGTQKDIGLFRLHENRVEFIGAAHQVSIRCDDILSIKEGTGNLTISTREQGSWSFDKSKLSSAGISKYFSERL